MKHTGPLWGIWKIEESSEVLLSLLRIMFRKHLGECCLATTDISCYCYIHLLIRIIYNLIMNNGAGAALAAKVQ